MSIVKKFGFGQRVMEAGILKEVEEMIGVVREKQGRPFDVRELITSCVANVIMNMVYGDRFEHSDPEFQQLIRNLNVLVSQFAFGIVLFPMLRYLPSYKRNLAQHVAAAKSCLSFVQKNIDKCIQVCNLFYFSLQAFSVQHNTIKSLCGDKKFTDAEARQR